MKTIIIEPVSNGWIVSHHYSCVGVSQGPQAVYNNIADLQNALPGLLDIEGAPKPYPAVIHVRGFNDQNSTTGVNPPPLAARDSDGGNTGL